MDNEHDGESGAGEAEVADLREQARILEEEVATLRRRLQDAPKRVRTLEERLLETKGQLAQAVSQNEKLTYTLREAREHIAALREEVDKLTQPPSAYGVLLGRNDDDTVTNIRVGYRLSHAIEVRSEDVDRLPRLAGDSSELLQQDVAFESGGFEFIYTKAGEAKVEMMAEATQDARERAERIATNGGAKVTALRSAKMGVVQINPLYSTATSWEGNNDTTSLDKTITATVTATFALR